MDDDFNTAGALAAVFELAKAANSFLGQYQADLCEDDRQVLLEAEELVVSLLRVLGIEISPDATCCYPLEVVDLAKDVAGYQASDPDGAVNALLAARAAARVEKDYARADAVRDGLSQFGFHIEDTPQGARVIYRSQD